MDARSKRRRRRHRGRRSFRLHAAMPTSARKAPVANDIRVDRRYLDLIVFADQFPVGVGRKSFTALLASARHVVAKLIGIVRQPAVVRLMPQLRPARTRVLALFLSCPSTAAWTKCANSYRAAEAGAPTQSTGLC